MNPPVRPVALAQESRRLDDYISSPAKGSIGHRTRSPSCGFRRSLPNRRIVRESIGRLCRYC
jgi:hypothetical protein